jgi:Holliday junction resolvase
MLTQKQKDLDTAHDEHVDKERKKKSTEPIYLTKEQIKALIDVATDDKFVHYLGKKHPTIKELKSVSTKKS